MVTVAFGGVGSRRADGRWASAAGYAHGSRSEGLHSDDVWCVLPIGFNRICDGASRAAIQLGCD
jgi:hypothetical protein